MRTKTPRLALVVPCYNEEAALPRMAPLFGDSIRALVRAGSVSDDSFVLFVNDGSHDGTWGAISRFSRDDPMFRGVSLSRNRGHQNALLCGLMEAKDSADIVVSADCDGQDDLGVLADMVAAWHDGADVVYACRDSRETDTWFKRTSAEAFYRIVSLLGGEIVFNHADYRLASARVLEALQTFREVNLFLRGLFPMVGFKSTRVFYSRKVRVAGDSHYPFCKMLAFAADGITSLSIRPLRLIALLGGIVFLLACLMIMWMLVSFACGRTVVGWASLIACSCLFGGIQLLSLGVIGEYVGKTYMESKGRPRYIIDERTS